jgi:hypothetical protein
LPPPFRPPVTTRYLQLGTTFGNAAVIRGDLTPECATVVRAVVEALGKKAGQEDDRTEGQRFHDALQPACAPQSRVCLLMSPAASPLRSRSCWRPRDRGDEPLGHLGVCVEGTSEEKGPARAVIESEVSPVDCEVPAVISGGLDEQAAQPGPVAEVYDSAESTVSHELLDSPLARMQCRHRRPAVGTHRIRIGPRRIGADAWK